MENFWKIGTLQNDYIKMLARGFEWATVDARFIGYIDQLVIEINFFLYAKY